MNERERLLKRVQMYSFAVTDAALFLDTHPNNMSALAYYNKYKKLYKDAADEFESRFGPLTIMSERNNEYWTWVNDPWPWEEQTEEVR